MQKNIHQEVRREVEVAMETGNHERAATIMTQYRAEYPEQARVLSADLVREYGRGL